MDLSDQCANLFAEIEHVQEILYERMKNRITSANLSDKKSVRETTGIFPDSNLFPGLKSVHLSHLKLGFLVVERGGGAENPPTHQIKNSLPYGGILLEGEFSVLDGRESFYTSIMFVMKSSVCFLFPLKRTPPLRYCNRMLYSVWNVV